MSHCTALRRRAPDQVDAWLHRYEPRTVSTAVWHGQLRDFVVPAVIDLQPMGLSAAATTVRVLTQIAAWCLSQGMRLNWETILDPDTVERFISVGIRHDRSRGTYRARLRHLGPLLTKKAPWEPRPEAVNRRQVSAPYSTAELEQLWDDALHQSTPARLRAGQALIALGAGAGLDGRWSTRVLAEDVICRGPVVLVRVGGPAARRVPVLARWEHVVVKLAATAGDQFLVGGKSLSRNRAGNLAGDFKVGLGHPALSGARLRATWLLHHLTAGTRIPELAAAAGLQGVTVLSDLLPYVPRLEDAEAARMLRGER
ncbi:MAG: hypothetical protein ACRDJ4_15000 [Actinomycetota bacterium]